MTNIDTERTMRPIRMASICRACILWGGSEQDNARPCLSTPVGQGGTVCQVEI